MLLRDLKIVLLFVFFAFSFGSYASKLETVDSLSVEEDLQEVIVKAEFDTLLIVDEQPVKSSENKLSLSRREKRSSVKEPFLPNFQKATWYAIVCPGLGQIYNRSYWKLPIVYGGVLAFTYLISWNGRMYNDYRNAYFDISDDDPTTDSYLDLSPNYKGTPEEKQKLTNSLKTKTTSYRRARDLSIFGSVALYVVSVIDAFVDAHLYDFEVSNDLSFRVEPVIENYSIYSYRPSVGVQCCLKFK